MYCVDEICTPAEGFTIESFQLFNNHLIWLSCLAMYCDDEMCFVLQRALPVKVAAARSLLKLTRKVKKREQRDDIFHGLIHGKNFFY